jgi:hypothetical protein
MSDSEKIPIDVSIPFTVQVLDNNGVEELELDKLYTVVEVRRDLINENLYGFTLLEVRPDEPYDSYLSNRFSVKVGVNPN